MPHTNLGAIERPEDKRDFLLGSVQAPVAIPAQYVPDVSWLVRNYQGQTPWCGEHALTHFQAILLHIFTPTVNQRYSPRFSAIKVKQIDGFPLDAGTDMRSLLKSLQNDGADDYEPLENDVTLPLPTYANPAVITPDMNTNAAAKKIVSYAFGNTDSQSLCQHIYQNKAVLLLIKCDDGFWGTATPTFTTPKYGHFVTAFGYDANSIHIIDSADETFGIKQIAKRYITPAFIIESGTGIDIPPEEVRAIIQNSQSIVTQVVTAPIPLEQKTDLLSQITVLLKLLASFFQQPKVGSSSQQMQNIYNSWISRTNWSAVVLLAYNFFTAIIPVFPDVPWISTIVNVLGVILIVVFHSQAVNKAATSSVTLGTRSSGQ